MRSRGVRPGLTGLRRSGSFTCPSDELIICYDEEAVKNQHGVIVCAEPKDSVLDTEGRRRRGIGQAWRHSCSMSLFLT